ncbi:PAS domain S-box-containing protein [Neobacillus niacini]|uniref:sigma-54 interaction domain-containing protein n=1 Tax=Neobacillus niacini TaxID=86668 RepID=UPI00278A7A47|nr:sigma 54-interacting transcriptional regulator [Neobacillus niacini]MDQ1005511.1 PAS domain S-box-containing protein [Neobacillus niacini]
MPKILAVTKDNRTYKLFFKQISDFFNGKVTILSSEQCHDYEKVDIILLSNKELQDDLYPEEKVLIARRTINIARLEELISLPAGTECLVVNNLGSTSSETIEILENLGFELKFYPYYPGIKTYQKVEVAIIPEALEMVPKGIKRMINIGLRPLDFSTLIELSLKLNINIDRANIQSARYIQEIIKLSRNLSYSFKEVAHLNHQLDAILNTVHDGILATDAEKNIIKINRSAKSMLGMHHSENEIIGKKVSEILPKLRLDSYIHDDLSQKNHVISFNERKLIINNSSIVVEEKNIGDVTAFQDVTRIQALEQEIRKKIQKMGFSSKYSISDIIGKSQRMKDILHIINKLAKTDRSVLILGENGTGKELFAHSIHQLSSRHNGPFIPVNFAGLPESLAESELFGYEEGTFTGAVKGGKQGLFELAHNGTIFMDEIGDAPKNLQTLLLRVLQEKQVMRVGGRSIIPVNVRVIAATNKDLKKMVEEGSFREDLYYRLFVLPLRVPTLRDRKEDIPELITHFFEEYCPTIPSISDDVMNELVSYDWPGNVRELASVVQYMITVMENNIITFLDLPEQFQRTGPSVKIDDTLLQLTKEGDLVDFHTILSSLLEAMQERKSIGRGKIVSYAKENGVLLTDQQVRRRMETLRDMGFIQSGTKGQGSKLTQMGMNTMKEMERIISENEKVMKRLS